MMQSIELQNLKESLKFMTQSIKLQNLKANYESPGRSNLLLFILTAFFCFLFFITSFFLRSQCGTGLPWWQTGAS